MQNPLAVLVFSIEAAILFAAHNAGVGGLPELLIMIAVLLGGRLAFTLWMRRRPQRDCPRCGNRLSTIAGPEPGAWFSLVGASICTECGWHADSEGRRPATVRSRN